MEVGDGRWWGSGGTLRKIHLFDSSHSGSWLGRLSHSTVSPSQSRLFCTAALESSAERRLFSCSAVVLLCAGLQPGWLKSTQLQVYLASFAGGGFPPQLLQSGRLSVRRSYAYGVESSEVHSSPGKVAEHLVAAVGRADQSKGSLPLKVGVVAGFHRFSGVALFSATPCSCAGCSALQAVQQAVRHCNGGALLQAVQHSLQPLGPWLGNAEGGSKVVSYA